AIQTRADFGRERRDFVVDEINLDASLGRECRAKAGQRVWQAEHGDGRRVQSVRNPLRVGAELLRELRRRFQLGPQRWRRSVRLLLQLSELNGQQCESLPDV